MLRLLVTLLCEMPLVAYTDEVGVEIAGVVITRGMEEAVLRAKIAEPYRIGCAEHAEGVTDDIKSCFISTTGEEPKILGELMFGEGRVLAAWRQIHIAEDQHQGLEAFYSLLHELTKGEKRCAIVGSSSGPPLSVSIALPEKTASMAIHVRGTERTVVLREGLRLNPTPRITLEDCWPQRK